MHKLFSISQGGKWLKLKVVKLCSTVQNLNGWHQSIDEVPIKEGNGIEQNFALNFINLFLLIKFPIQNYRFVRIYPKI